jgi:hypothetical protein
LRRHFRPIRAREREGATWPAARRRRTAPGRCSEAGRWAPSRGRSALRPACRSSAWRCAGSAGRTRRSVLAFGSLGSPFPPQVPGDGLGLGSPDLPNAIALLIVWRRSGCGQGQRACVAQIAPDPKHRLAIGLDQLLDVGLGEACQATAPDGWNVVPLQRADDRFDGPTGSVWRPAPA